MHGIDNFKIVGLFKDAVFIEEVIFYRCWYQCVNFVNSCRGQGGWSCDQT
jgi:hypothetical protein